MKLDELLHRFQGDLQIRNYSARTVTDYGYSLALLLRFLEQRNISDIQSVTAATLTEFQRWVYYQPTKRGAAPGKARTVRDDSIGALFECDEAPWLARVARAGRGAVHGAKSVLPVRLGHAGQLPQPAPQVVGVVGVEGI